MNKTELFIEKAIKVHGNKYNYSKVEYINAYTKVCITCPIHGEFWQVPHDHLKGAGCKICGKIKNSNALKMTMDLFLEKARNIHGDKYNYSKVQYIDYNTKVCIICPIHGEFYQTPNNHIQGQGCPHCGKIKFITSKKYTLDKFIEKAKKIYGEKYEYSDIGFIDLNHDVTIKCPLHGFFNKKAKYFLDGHSCPTCARIATVNSIKNTTSKFIEKAKKVHGDKYDYSMVEYVNNKTKVRIICPIHDEFEQTPDDHLQGKGCPKCEKQISKAENEIYDFCCSYIGIENVNQRNRDIIKPQELDIYLPSLKCAIEYNGLRWHSDKYCKDRNYHLNKLNACKDKGIKLLQIFEDEYINKKDIVYNKIKHILHFDDELPKIMGRKCNIREIYREEAENFLERYHIQGFVSSTIYLGAFYEDKLVGVMTFKKEDKECLKWELTRFASNYNYICQGIGGKLFKHFIKEYNPTEIKSFADRRWTIDEENNIYIQLGFKFDSYTSVEYRYFKESDGMIRQHKFGFRKQHLNRKYGLPLTMTENEMTTELGYSKIWDCGLIKYVWKKG